MPQHPPAVVREHFRITIRRAGQASAMAADTRARSRQTVEASRALRARLVEETKPRAAPLAGR